MSSSDTPNEKEDADPNIYNIWGNPLKPGEWLEDPQPYVEPDITKILDSGITDITNPIPGVTSLVSFFAAISYLYSTVKEHPAVLPFFLKKRMTNMQKHKDLKVGII